MSNIERRTSLNQIRRRQTIKHSPLCVPKVGPKRGLSAKSSLASYEDKMNKVVSSQANIDKIEKDYNLKLVNCCSLEEDNSLNRKHSLQPQVNDID